MKRRAIAESAEVAVRGAVIGCREAPRSLIAHGARGILRSIFSDGIRAPLPDLAGLRWQPVLAREPEP